MSNRDSDCAEPSAGASQEDLIETCERCGGDIDANRSGHYKSPSEIFVHKVCYEEGGPGDPVLDLIDEYPFTVLGNPADFRNFSRSS